MTDHYLAIIGTAGRKDDAPKLSSASFDRMVNAVALICNHYNTPLDEMNLVSGGAAWADHVAVELVLRKIVPYSKLTLYIPALFEDMKFIGNADASTINYYHQLFSDKVGRNTLAELDFVRSQGSTFISGSDGFKGRNTLIAQSVSNSNGSLIAFTFGSNESLQTPWTARMVAPYDDAKTTGLKPGGTAHTWNLARCFKHHVRLGDLV